MLRTLLLPAAVWLVVFVGGVVAFAPGDNFVPKNPRLTPSAEYELLTRNAMFTAAWLATAVAMTLLALLLIAGRSYQQSRTQ
ncbi:MAG: hypothetical protein H6817_07205 [Phycisphaerales bacterium]|nr:hypothetical protein [Phycisphaerales bacterium]